MLMPDAPGRLVVLGFTLLLGSWLVLLLMGMRVIVPSPLSIVAYATSVAGLAIGLFGLVQYLRGAQEK